MLGIILIARVFRSKDKNNRIPMTKRSKLWIAAAAVLLLALVGTGVAFNQSKKADGAPKKEEVPPLEFAQAELVYVEPATLVHELVLPGSVQAVNQATVRAKLSAEVRRVLVREGDSVAAGQVLAEFDTRPLRAQLAERQATYDSARAQLASTDRIRQANAQLVQQNFISQNAFDTADSNHQAQLATVAAARAALEQT
ncbi:MAG: biotin/lipoyl-binding protein, partial [Burkholderiaceae bacterium]